MLTGLGTSGAPDEPAGGTFSRRSSSERRNARPRSKANRAIEPSKPTCKRRSSKGLTWGEFTPGTVVTAERYPHRARVLRAAVLQSEAFPKGKAKSKTGVP